MGLASHVGRRLAAVGVSLAALAAPGCEDDRELTTGPTVGFLGGDGLFGTAVVTTSILRYQNDAALRILEILENNLSTPIFETGCAGSGQRVITRDSQNPNRFRIQHGTSAGSYTIDCNVDLRLTLNGDMYIEWLETSPGLHFTIEMPFNHLTGNPEGMIYALPADFGSAILDVTTPGHTANPILDPYGSNGVLDCALDAGGLRHEGFVHETGTIRIEERVQTLLLVEELEIEYAFDESLSSPFSPWPTGRYEIASLSSLGFFAGAVVSAPVDVTFDGFGGAVFPLGDRICEVNLRDGTNPCEDL
jgi:hypothetical protein